MEYWQRWIETQSDPCVDQKCLVVKLSAEVADLSEPMRLALLNGSSLEGQAGPRQMGIFSDAMIDGLKRITSVVHENDGVIALQLGHAGQQGIGKSEYAALGPSDVFEAGVKKASAMTVDDIKKTVRPLVMQLKEQSNPDLMEFRSTQLTAIC